MDSSVAVINWMQSTFGESGRFFFEFFSVCGGPYGWTLLVPLVFWLSGSKAGIRIALAITLTMITNTLLKWLIAEPRPYLVSDQVQAVHAVGGFGMPSGHAQGVAAIWLMVAYSVRSSWCAWLAIVFIVCTGAARVYFGVHSHQQVVIGWALGLLGAVGAIRFEAFVVRWFQTKPRPIQLAAVLILTTLIILLGYVVGYGLRGDVAPAPAWQARWQDTIERIGMKTDPPPPLVLIRHHLVSLMAVLFLVFSICGLSRRASDSN